MTTISIEVLAGDLSELVGKKLVQVKGGHFWLLLTFEDGTTLDIASKDGWDDCPASLDLELSYESDKSDEEIVSR